MANKKKETIKPFYQSIALKSEIDAADKLIKIFENIFSQPEQFYYHVCTEKRVDDDGMLSEVLCEKKLNSINSKRLLEATGALQKAVELKMQLTGHIDEAKLMELSLKKEKMELEKQKAAVNIGDSETGVVILPEVDKDE